ncbi:MAG: serine hydrolase [Bacteroidia bacterium]|nr:serine hydrolase [Bacteroidia bacterium]
MKRGYFLRVIAIVFLVITTSIFIVHRNVHIQKTTIHSKKLPDLFNFSNAEQYADSMLKKLSLNDKITQLFILPHTQKMKNIGGYFYPSLSDSVITDNSALPYFNVISYPQNEKYIPYLATLGTVKNQKVLEQQINALIYQIKKRGFNFLLLPSTLSQYLYQTDCISPNETTQIHHLKIFQKQCTEQRIVLCLSTPKIYTRDSQYIRKQGKIWRELKEYLINAIQVSNSDSTFMQPLYYSRYFVQDILRKTYYYNGLVLTDRLDKSPQPVKYVELLKNDVDVLVCPPDVKKAIREIRKAIIIRKISIQSLNNKVKRVLMAKYFIQQRPKKPLTDIYAQAAYRNTLAHSVCLLKNDKNLLPFATDFNFSTWTCISLNADNYTPFQATLAQFVNGLEFKYLPFIANEKQLKTKLNKIRENVIMSIHGILSPEKLKVIDTFCLTHSVVIVHFGPLYAPLSYYTHARSVIYHLQDDSDAQDILAQAILGAYPVQGKFEFLLSAPYQVHTYQACRLGRGLPEEGEMYLTKYKVHQHLDSMLKEWIKDKVMPGGQIMVAHKGKIVYQKAFGHLTYEATQKVKMQTLYDVASLTKICATTLMCMRAYQDSLLKLQDSLKKYLPYLDTAKGTLKNAVIQKLLTHHSGAGIGLPVYTFKFFQKDAPQLKRYFSTVYKELSSKDKKHILKKDTAFTIPVAANLYFRNDVWDTILYHISRINLQKENEYEYSDFNMYLLQKVVENLYEKPLNEWIEQEFYNKMHLKRTCFLPLRKFNLEEIAPTEKDDFWRRQLIHGYVHDPTAALCGNVCGNAGLFSDALGITAIGQMLLNYGYYGRHQLLDTNTILLFTAAQPGTFRGLGFNKPPLQRDSLNHPWQMSYRCSPRTYGHTGFTGTCLWVDPQYELVFVMLTNRVHPKADNKKLIERGIRQYVQSLFYEAIGVEPRPVSKK